MLLLSGYVLFAPGLGGDGLFFGSDKVVHFGLFALLAATARWRFGRHSAVLGAVVVYAATSELVQAVLLSSRGGDGFDLLADALGALLGWSAAGRRLRTPPG